MSATLPAAHRYCPECHAENPVSAGSCWLCHRQFTDGSEIVMAELVRERSAPTPSELLLPLLTALVAGLVVLVGIGIGRDDPYLLIPYTLVVGLGLAITLLREVRVRATGGRVGWGERLLTFIISVHAVAAALLVIFLAAGVAFVIFLCLVCAGGLAR